MTGYRFETLLCGPLGNNVYVVYSPDTKEALAIDPGLESADAVDGVLAKHGLRLTTVVATHRHWDHIAEAGVLLERHSAAMLAHAKDAAFVTQPGRPMMFPDLVVPPAPVTRELVEGDVVQVGDSDLVVMHTPGHTPGSMCLYDALQGHLFAGDTLFNGSFGRYDLPGGDPAALRQSLLRLSTLPPDTQVLPGHGERTTIQHERWLSNPPI